MTGEEEGEKEKGMGLKTHNCRDKEQDAGTREATAAMMPNEALCSL